VSQVTPASPNATPAPPETASARLNVVALPTEARVAVDGLVLRSNPGSIDLPRGVHRVRVEAPGYYALTRVVDLEGDLSVEYALRNEPPRVAPPRQPEPFTPRKTPRPRRELDHEDPYAP
jgi:hypothetical protein